MDTNHNVKKTFKTNSTILKVENNEYYNSLNSYIIWFFRFICKLISGIILIGVLYCSSTYYVRTEEYWNKKIWFFPLPKQQQQPTSPTTTTQAIFQIVYNQTAKHVSFLCSNGRPKLWPGSLDPPYCWFFVFGNDQNSEIDDDSSQWNLSEYGYDYIVPSNGTLIIYDVRLKINIYSIDNCAGRAIAININERRFNVLVVKTEIEFNTIIQEKSKCTDGIDFVFTLHDSSLVSVRSALVVLHKRLDYNYSNLLLEK